jgi:hypothetical protein
MSLHGFLYLNKMNVYVEGIGGLGNILFQLSTAIYYAEKYGMKIKLLLNDIIKFGTSNKFGTIKCVDGYNSTIFNKLEFTEHIENCDVVTNNYTSNKIIPSKHIFIKGYCQNIDLFREYFDRIPNYLSFKDTPEKYGDLSNAVCIGVRVRRDFAHMKKINQSSYIKAIEYLKANGLFFDKILIIGDVDSYWTDNRYDVIHVNDDDITQFSVGLQCKYYVLSESTFHLWIAYIGTLTNSDKKVICFNDTDITTRNLHLPSWIKLDY